ncbi:MAG: rRNA (adenine2503-C2)-methyltransferase, partial [Actinomycetota bacterium]|nr:rRNA (adenine2503-C2)-methyltransferase [Actinomycetota bacterium]
MTAVTSTRYSTRRADLDALVAELGEPAYRARQLHEGLYEQRRPLESLTNLPKALRARIADALPLAFTVDTMQLADDDMTAKWLWRAGDGAQIETVLMRYSARATVCVSSQAGCAMGCTFCATGQAGFERQLSAGEIVEQVARAQHASPQRVSNVVFMGMGEPLANVDAVLDACTRLHDDLGISARHITVSTVGVVPGIERLTDFELPVTLAVSLHAPDDLLREQLVPLNRRYPLAAVLDAARAYADRKGRRVSFEYACISGVNDLPHHADALAGRLTGFRGGA